MRGEKMQTVKSQFRMLYLRRNKLTDGDIRVLVALLRNADPDGLPGKVALRDADHIIGADNSVEQRKEAIAVIEKWHLAWRREEYHGKHVDYRKWPLNTMGLMGDKIGICPICGKKGEVQESDDTLQFTGKTMHVVEAHLLGVIVLEACDWKPDPARPDGMKRLGEMNLILPKDLLAEMIQTLFHNKTITLPDGTEARTMVEKQRRPKQRRGLRRM
jgi:hypothetical protein